MSVRFADLTVETGEVTQLGRIRLRARAAEPASFATHHVLAATHRSFGLL
jgi:hypothetical protein